MFDVVYLYSCLRCCSPVDTASGPVSDVHVYLRACFFPPPILDSVIISSFLFFLSPCLFFLSFSSSLLGVEKLWHRSQTALFQSVFSCLSFQCSCFCGEKPLETLSGSITVLRSGWSWSYKKISDRYWDFVLPLHMHTTTTTYPERHPVSDIWTYTAESRMCTYMWKWKETVFFHTSVNSNAPGLLNEVAHSTHLVNFWVVRAHFLPSIPAVSLTERSTDVQMDGGTAG